jgi:hypothetical protein
MSSSSPSSSRSAADDSGVTEINLDTPDVRAADFRIVKFRETDYRTGCVTSREVEAPVINRFSDHVLVRLPDGASLRVQEKRR